MSDQRQTNSVISRSRRRLLILVGLLPLTKVFGLQRLPRTPMQTAGPFYPDPPPTGADDDLTRREGAGTSGDGEPLLLSGRVLDELGKPQAGALVEVWQCDTHGRYHHPRDRGAAQRDPAFQGYARQQVGQNGEYSVRCIRPVAYPGRTPHIHLAVRMASRLPLVTQLYIAGDPRNNEDFIYRGLGAVGQRLVTLDLQAADHGWVAAFDPVLDAG